MDLKLHNYMDLTFKRVSLANKLRCSKIWGGNHLNEWNEMSWGSCLAGEVGEALNLIKKKYGRKENIPLKDIAMELADTFMYLDLLATKCGIDLEKAIIQKFNKVSRKHKCNIKL